MNATAAAGCTAIIGFMALVLSVTSVSWCEFVGFTLIGPSDREVSFGAWRYNSFVLIQNVDTGDIWKVETCESYPDSVSLDGYWKASRAFAILAPILGVIAAIMVFCMPGLGRASGGLFLLATISQGLTFLIMKSDLCDASTNPFFNLFDEAISRDDTCEMGSSAITSIVATVLWFICFLIPAALGSSDDADEDDMAKPQPEVEAQEEEQP